MGTTLSSLWSKRRWCAGIPNISEGTPLETLETLLTHLTSQVAHDTYGQFRDEVLPDILSSYQRGSENMEPPRTIPDDHFLILHDRDVTSLSIEEHRSSILREVDQAETFAQFTHFVKSTLILHLTSSAQAEDFNRRYGTTAPLEHSPLVISIRELIFHELLHLFYLRSSTLREHYPIGKVEASLETPYQHS